MAPRPASFKRMVGRALLRRCPRCGGKHAWFTGWFARTDRCHTCGYRYGRQEGFALGALTMNTLVTFGLLALDVLVGSIVGYPDIAVVPMLVIGGIIAVVVPVVFYPFSYTLWAAVDLAMQPLESEQIADAELHVGAGHE